eukprot:1933157-Amphidinium_carterae.2
MTGKLLIEVKQHHCQCCKFSGTVPEKHHLVSYIVECRSKSLADLSWRKSRTNFKILANKLLEKES